MSRVQNIAIILLSLLVMSFATSTKIHSLLRPLLPHGAYLTNAIEDDIPFALGKKFEAAWINVMIGHSVLNTKQHKTILKFNMKNNHFLDQKEQSWKLAGSINFQTGNVLCLHRWKIWFVCSS